MAAYRKGVIAATMFAGDVVAQGLVVGTAAKWISIALHALTVAGVIAIANEPKVKH